MAGKKGKYMIPSAKLPAVVRARQMEEKVREMAGKNDTLRRLLWMAITVAGGRIEIDEPMFRQTMNPASMPADDTLVKYEPQESHGKKVVVLLHCDEEGETIDDPGAGRIIIPAGIRIDAKPEGG